MNTDYILLAIGWVASIIIIILFIPKERIRLAQVAFLSNQAISWILGLAVVELRLIEYPIRFFTYSYKGSFTFEYLVYPSICAVFNVHYPEKKNALCKFMYYFYYCTAITCIEVIVERFSNIIKYVHWSWYVTWISLFITFYICRKYCQWFFRQNHKQNNG